MLLAAYLLLISGCGASGSDFVATGDSGQQGLISGELFLGRGIPGAPIEVYDLSGKLLASTTTNEIGDFQINGFPATPDFRVVAKLGQDMHFSTEVRGYTGNRFVVINVPTTLVSRYMQAHPELDPAAAEDVIQELLRFPTDRSLEYGVEEAARMPFSHLAFFHAMAENGGWEAYLSRILGEVKEQNGDQGSVPAEGFRLTRKVAHKSLATVDERVRPYLEEFLSRRGTRMDLVSEHANPAPSMKTLLEGGVGGVDAPDPGLSSREADISQVRASVVTSIVKYTASTVASKTQQQLVNAGWTHIADALNLNYGTTAMLEQIQDQLIEVIGMVTDISQEVSDLGLETATTDLDDDINKINELYSDLANANGGSDGIGGTPGSTPGNTVSGTVLANPETPYQQPAEVATLLDSLGTFTTTVSLTAIQNEMLGTGNISNILTTNRSTVYSNIGVSPSSSFGNSPVRSKKIIDQLLPTYEYYSQIQQNACTVIGELAHITNPNPQSDIVSAYNTINDAAISLKKQRGQLPQYLLSDQIVVDLQAGLMWYYKVKGADDVHTADSNAAAFTLDVGHGVTYDDWRLPSDKEMYWLQDRARTVTPASRDSNVAHDGSDSSAGNYGYSAQGLPALGFEQGSVEGLSSDAHLWCRNYSWDEPVFGDSSWGYVHNDFMFNHSNAIISGNLDNDSGTFKYLYVRNIGEPVFVEDDDDDRKGYPYTYNSIKAQEFSTLGYLSALGFVGIVDGKAGATATYTVTVGGNATLSGDSYSLTSRSYTHYVDTYSGYSNAYAGPVNLAEQVWYEDPSGKLTVGFDGDIYWHNDTANHSSSVPVTAYAMSTNGNIISGTGNFSANSTPVRSVTDVQIWPRNKRYDMTALPETTDNYFCLAYYSDNTVVDVTGTATWSVAKSGGGASVSTSIGNNSTAGKELVFKNNVLDEGVSITASFGGQTDTASGEVFNDAPPLIKGVIPGFGSAAGGNEVTLLGDNFVGVTAVHFNGVQVSFVVDTGATQVTVTAPPGITGPSQITVTTANGTSPPAVYQYL